MKFAYRSLTLLFLAAFLALNLFAEDDPNPNSPAPVLVSGSDQTRVLAVLSDSFRGVVPPLGRQSFLPGQRTTINIFLEDLELQPDEGFNSFRVYILQNDGKTYEMSPENLERTKSGRLSIKVRLFDANGFRGQPHADGDSWIYVTWRGLASNPLKIGLGRTGGKLKSPSFANAIFPEENNAVGYRWSGDRTRFLEQATFGASSQTEDRLRRIGPRIWLAEQFDMAYPSIAYPEPAQMPTTPPTDCQPQTNPTCYRDRYTMIPLQLWFFREAMYGEAQLRHRISWALGQIWVTSGVTTTQSSHAISYQKLLARHAFGNYRQLMVEATLNPTMGNYLDMVRSTKLSPNENYPREILQLFSIGLVMLNQDGTPKLDGQGNTIPTYDQDSVNNFSKVFTGWGFCNTANCPGASPGVVNYKDPMVLVPANHDTTSKTLLSYPGAVNTTIDACPMCTNDSATTAYANDSLQRTIDNIFYHPNVGPYIGKLLIQQLVTSDPSPSYVSRVAGAFNNNGGGVRGDMKAVIRAILLDPEARGDIKTAPRYGKMREPVQLITNLGRVFPAKAFNGIDPSDGALSSSASSMGQNPFYSPTVFNYYAFDHIVPGTTILAPEFDIFNTGTSVKRTNFLYLLTFEGITANATDSLRGTSLDYSEFIPYSQNDTSGNELIDILNAKMLHGTLSLQHRALILAAIQAVSPADSVNRVKTAAYLLACSSQFQIQR